MKLVYCSANIYLLVYISHFLPIISRRHLKHTADKSTCAWEFKKPFIFCFIRLRYIQAKINEQLYSKYNVILLTWLKSNFVTATWKIICNSSVSHLTVCLLLDRYYYPDLILRVILNCHPISVRGLRRELVRKLQNPLLPFWALWYSEARHSLIIN